MKIIARQKQHHSVERSRTIDGQDNLNHLDGPGYTIGLSQALETQNDEQEPMFKTGITGELPEGDDPQTKKERYQMLKANLALCEERLKDKTTDTLARCDLVQKFQKYKEDAKVKNWQQIHQFQKQQVAGIKLEAE